MSANKFLRFTPLLLLFIAAGCGKDQKAPQGPPPVSVTVQPVTASDASYYDEYPAIVRALNEVELRAQVNGYITGIHFKEGESVRKGQKLYSIDQQQTLAAYNQALANLSLQEANLERAKKDVERYRSLDKQDATSKQQVDNAEATFEIAKQQVAAAQATVQSAQTNVRYSTIVAPFDGTIGISMVRLGTSVTPGQTLLNTISSDDPIGVDITVDQREIYRFTSLLSAKHENNDSTFRLAFNDELYPEYGRISIIDRAVDAQTGTIKMRIIFPNPDHRLRAGMSGSLKVLNRRPNTIVIPHKAVNEQLGEFFVYMPDSSRATQRKIKLGTSLGKNIIVLEGLSQGDQIITEGLQNLREGSSIVIAASEKK